VSEDHHQILTLAGDAGLSRSAGYPRIRARAVAAGPAIVGVRVGIDTIATARDERSGTRQIARTAHADLTRVADLASVSRAIPAAFRRTAIVPVGVRVHTGAAALDQARMARQRAHAVAAHEAGIAFLPALATVSRVDSRIDARAIALGRAPHAGEPALASGAHLICLAGVVAAAAVVRIATQRDALARA